MRLPAGCHLYLLKVAFGNVAFTTEGSPLPRSPHGWTRLSPVTIVSNP